MTMTSLAFAMLVSVSLALTSPGKATHLGSQAQNNSVRALLERFSDGHRISDADQDAFHKFVSSHIYSGFGNYTLGVDSYVWRFHTSTTDCFLVLVNPQPIFTPSPAHSWMAMVREDGQILEQHDFDIGWRMYPKAASFGRQPWLSSNVIRVETKPGMTNNPATNIYIAFDGTQPIVVRLETSKGSLRHMPYFAPNWVVGPNYAPPTIKELEHKLNSGSEVHVLGALTWLNGHHSKSSANGKDSVHEEALSQDRYDLAIHSTRIASAVKALALSKNTYIRELAARIPLGKGNVGLDWDY